MLLLGFLANSSNQYFYWRKRYWCITQTAIHSRLNHPNIVSLIGAGTTSKGVRFVILERLDGGTLTQMLGYDTRIRDRRRRFWKRKPLSYLDVLRCARSIAAAMSHCHADAIPGCMVLHRDLKPDNIGFALDGSVKVLDFGLARIVENASVKSNDVYQMSGETGSLRYMAPGKRCDSALLPHLNFGLHELTLFVLLSTQRLLMHCLTIT